MHVRVALKSPPCPAQVVRMAAHGWGTPCARTMQAAHLSAAPLDGGQCRGNILVCCRKQQ